MRVVETEGRDLRVHRGDESRRTDGVDGDRRGGVVPTRQQHSLEQLRQGEGLICLEPHERVGT